jgi:anti-sigma regulatory factor (Ser/Thr protein kinase)
MAASRTEERVGGFDLVRTLRLDRGPDAASAAREALDELRFDADPELIDDIRLLVSELVTAGVTHSGPDAARWMRLKITIVPSGVRVELGTPGQRWLFEPGQELPVSIEEGTPLGLYLVDRLADRWGLQRAGDTHIWFEIDAEPQPLA